MPTNKSKNVRKTNSSGLTSDIAERGREFLEGTAQERGAKLQKEEAASTADIMEQAVASGLSGDDLAAANKVLTQKINAIDRLNPRIAMFGETRMERAINGVRSDVRRSFEGTGAAAKAASLSSVNAQAAISRTDQPYSALESEQEQYQTRLNRLQALSSRTAGRLFRVNESGESEINPLAQKRLESFETERERVQGGMASGLASMRMQKNLGQDPNSVMQARIQALGQAENILGTSSAKEAVASGQGLGGLSAKALDNLTQVAAKNLADAFEKLKKGVEGAGEEVDQYAKELKDLGSIQAAGGGKGGATADRYGFAAGAFGSAGNIIQQVDVNQRLGQMYNIAGLAGIENQKYDMYKKSRGGDVASQMALSQWAAATKFGSEIKFSANEALTYHAAGGVAQAAAGVAQATEATGEKFNPAAYIFGTATANTSAALAGTTNALQGAATSSIAVGDIARGVSGDQAKIVAINAQMEAAKQVMAIPAAQLQGFRDFTTGMGVTARGMGAGSGAFIRSMVSDPTLERMAGQGISPEQMAQMAQSGQANMGSMFDKTGEQVFAARGLEKSGYGTMQENMQRMGTLAAAGANNPQVGLTGVLEAAFGKSLENAKTLTALVENTGAMASRSGVAAMGLDATAQAATMLTAGMDPNQANREFALQRARTAAERVNDIVTDESVSFANMSALGRIQKIPGMSGAGSVAWRNKLSVLDLKTIQDIQDPEKAAQALRKFGVPANAAGVKDEVGSLLENAQLKVLERGGMPVGADVRKMLKKINSGAQLTADEEVLKGQVAAFGGFAGGSDNMDRAVKGITAKNDPNAKDAVEKITKGEGGSKELKDADLMLTDGFAQLSEAALSAAKQLGGATEAMKKLVDLQKLAKAEGGAKGEEEFSGAAAKSAGSTMFSEGAKTFNTAASKWDSIADKLIKAGIGEKSSYSTPSGTSGGDTKSGVSPGGHS